MKTGSMINVLVAVVVVLAGLVGAGMLWDKYFGGADQRETNKEQNVRLDRTDSSIKRLDDTDNQFLIRHNESDRKHLQHTTDLKNHESKIIANRESIVALQAADAALNERLDAQNKVIEGMQAEAKARDTTIGDLQRTILTNKAEADRKFEEQEAARKHQEERIRRIERILGVGDPQQ